MPRWQRIFVSASCAAIGFCVAYVLADFGQWPKPVYFPLDHQWEWLPAPVGPISMAYLGLVLWGAIGGAVSTVAALAGCALVRRPVRDVTLRLWGAWALAAFAFAGLYFTWSLWPF